MSKKKEQKEEFTNTDLSNLYGATMTLLSIGKTKFEFNFAFIEIKKVLKPLAEPLMEKQEKLQTERQELILKYCNKDDKGNAILFTNELGEREYKGLLLGEKPEFDKRKKVMDAALKSLMKTIVPDFDINEIKQTIKKDDLPTWSEKYTGHIQDAISRFIKD